MQNWKKSSPEDCVSPRGHFAPRLFLLSSSFSEINSSAKIRMALKRHTVLYRLTFLKKQVLQIFFLIDLENLDLQKRSFYLTSSVGPVTAASRWEKKCWVGFLWYTVIYRHILFIFTNNILINKPGKDFR